MQRRDAAATKRHAFPCRCGCSCRFYSPSLRRPASLRRSSRSSGSTRARRSRARRPGCSSFRPTADTPRCSAAAEDRERYDLWAMDTSTGQLADAGRFRRRSVRRRISEAEKMRRERARIGGARASSNMTGRPTANRSSLRSTATCISRTCDGCRPTADQHAGKGNRRAIVSEGGRYRQLRARPKPLCDRPRQRRRAKALTTEGKGTVTLRHRRIRRAGRDGSPHRQLVGAQGQPGRGRMLSTKPTVKTVTRAAIGATGTKVFEQRYPAAGTPNVDRHAVADELGRQRPDEGRSRRGPRHLSRPRQLVEGRPHALTSSARTATRSGSTCWPSTRRTARRVLSQRDGAGLDQPQRRLPIAEGRKLHLGFRANRLSTICIASPTASGPRSPAATGS